MELKMFDIVYADLTKGRVGSEQSGIHPYIVIQNNMGNANSPTFIGMSLTSELKKENLPTHAIIHKTDVNGLECDSMLLGETIIQIDKKRVIRKLGHVDNKKEQDDILNIFMANITGRKRYNPFYWKIISLLFKFVKEVNHGGTI